MRTLRFDVQGQRLKRNADCDFTHIVSGSVGYLKAAFNFSSEWDGCKKVASFWLGEKEHAVLLDEDNTCMIPPAALTGNMFLVSVIGAKTIPKYYRISTSRIRVRQEV